MNSGSKSKRLALMFMSLDHLPAKYLVAGLHVGQDGVIQDVGHDRQQLVGDHMPEHRHPPGASQEAGAVDHICDLLLDRLKQFRIVTWIVLQVRILDQQDVALGRLHAGHHCSSLALIFFVEDHAQAIPSVQFSQDVTRTVFGAIIDHDDFVCQFLGLYSLDNFSNIAHFVIHRNNN